MKVLVVELSMKNKDKNHWIVMVVCCGLSSASIGLIINAMGVFYTPVAQSLGVMQGTIAAQGTITLILASGMSFSVPRVLKKYNYKKVLLVSIAIASISTIMMGFVTHILPFHLLGAVRGLSAAFFSIVPLTMIINQWFEKKHGLATSLVLGLSGMAGAIFSPIFASLIENFGWEITYFIKGLILFLLGLPAILYPFSMKPEDDGLLPYGQENSSKKAVMKIAIENEASKFKIVQVSFLCFLVFSTLIAALTTIAHHLPSFAASIGHNSATGALLLSAAMVGNVIFKVIIGLLTDAIGAINSCLLMIGINLIGLLMLMFAQNDWTFVLASFLFGALFSVGSVGAALLTKHFFGLRNYPKCYPFVSFIGGIGAALALMGIGYIYDFTGSFRATFIIALIFHALSMLLFIVVIVKERKMQLLSVKK